jgi:hypothetical protein
MSFDSRHRSPFLALDFYPGTKRSQQSPGASLISPERSRSKMSGFKKPKRCCKNRVSVTVRDEGGWTINRPWLAVLSVYDAERWPAAHEALLANASAGGRGAGFEKGRQKILKRKALLDEPTKDAERRRLAAVLENTQRKVNEVRNKLKDANTETSFEAAE